MGAPYNRFWQLCIFITHIVHYDDLWANEQKIQMANFYDLQNLQTFVQSEQHKWLVMVVAPLVKLLV